MHRRRNSFASSSARLSRLYRILPTLTLITVEQVVLAQPQIWRCGSGLLWMSVRKISPQTGIRSPPISGPRPSFIARSRHESRSPASSGPIPPRTLSGSCADAVRVDPELGGSCADASVLLVAGEDLCGAVVSPRRCLGPTRCSRNICGACC